MSSSLLFCPNELGLVVHTLITVSPEVEARGPELKASLTNLNPVSSFKTKGNSLLGGDILAKHAQGPATIPRAVINRRILSNWTRRQSIQQMHSNEPAIPWTLRALPLPAELLGLHLSFPSRCCAAWGGRPLSSSCVVWITLTS